MTTLRKCGGKAEEIPSKSRSNKWAPVILTDNDASQQAYTEWLPKPKHTMLRKRVGTACSSITGNGSLSLLSQRRNYVSFSVSLPCLYSKTQYKSRFNWRNYTDPHKNALADVDKNELIKHNKQLEKHSSMQEKDTVVEFSCLPIGTSEHSMR